ncbi:MAG TPA: Rho termination factor N-terminal domain-containing protein, partial [Nocardioidaceae bacterium]|nr:Rho termination factor N-terminal domain-containing protein [Nocardioidaceae bacterium]
MTDTSTTSPPADVAGDGTTTPASTGTSRRRSGGGLNGMVLAELQQVAGGLGIKGTTRMRKSQLIEAIGAAQTQGQGGARADGVASTGSKSSTQSTA